MIRYIFLFVFLWQTCPGTTLYFRSYILHIMTMKNLFPLKWPYKTNVGFIEADVFLRDDNLFVAHESKQIQKDKTLETLYFNPLKKLIEENGGHAYADKEKSLTLMIDLKPKELPR
jgi:hypothetical protein